MTWRLLPSAARVRPAPTAVHNSPSVRCTPLACANDLTPCRDALHFVYASATATTPSKRPGLRLRGGRRTPFRYRYTSCTPSMQPVLLLPYVHVWQHNLWRNIQIFGLKQFVP